MTSNTVALPSPSDKNIKLENNSEEPNGIDICIDLIQYTCKELRDHSNTIVVGAVISYFRALAGLLGTTPM